jgi:hypothetical protein
MNTNTYESRKHFAFAERRLLVGLEIEVDRDVLSRKADWKSALRDSRRHSSARLALKIFRAFAVISVIFRP